MSTLARLSVVVIVLGFLIQGIEALTCYTCESRFNKDCHDDDEHHATEVCAYDQIYCLFEKDEANDYYQRRCAKMCESTSMNQQCCKTDRCNGNGARRLTSATFTLMTLTGTSFAVMKLLS